MTIKVMLADDHALVLEGIKAVLERKANGIVVSCEAPDGKKLLEAARKKPADVYVLDIAMPLLNGIETAARLLRQDKKAKIIFLSMYNDKSSVEKAMKTGAKGYLLKENAADEIVKAVQEVYRGGFYVSAPVSDVIAERMRNKTLDRTKLESQDRLTSKEKEIIQLIAEGLPNKQIARELKISENTVHAHRNNIARKLDIHKQTELVRYAIKEKIVKL